MIESIRSTILAEHEAMLRQERTLHEERVRVLHTQHEEELERVRSEERNRETAEQQVKFNEGLKKAVDEREKAVKALEDKTRHFKEEVNTTTTDHITNLLHITGVVLLYILL